MCAAKCELTVDIKDEDLVAMFDVNGGLSCAHVLTPVLGLIRLTQVFVREMKKQNSGVGVAISSGPTIVTLLTSAYYQPRLHCRSRGLPRRYETCPFLQLTPRLDLLRDQARRCGLLVVAHEGARQHGHSRLRDPAGHGRDRVLHRAVLWRQGQGQERVQGSHSSCVQPTACRSRLSVCDSDNPVTAQDIAEEIVWIASRPDHVQVAQMRKLMT